ncbi:MAG: hypothetical protein AB2A00_21545 [Myxococcota bacterium]
MRRQRPDAGPTPLPDLFPYAALTGALGFLPLPFLDEYANAQVRGAMLNHVAARHGLSLDPYARERLARGYKPSTGVARRVGLKAVGLVFRRVFAVLNAGVAAEDAAQTLILGHLFDRYCTLMHDRSEGRTVVGEMAAIRIRGALDSAVLKASRSARKDLFQRSMSRALGSLRDLPSGVVDTLRQLVKRRPLGAERMVDQLIQEEQGYFTRVAERAVSALNGMGNAYLQRVQEAFDAAMDYRPGGAAAKTGRRAASRRRGAAARSRKRAAATQPNGHPNGARGRARRETGPSA